MKKPNRYTVFLSRKEETKILRGIVKRHYRGKGIHDYEQSFLHAHGYKQSVKIQFYDQDMDNFVSNKITVRIDFKLEIIGNISITVNKIIRNIFPHGAYYYNRRSATWFRVSKMILEDESLLKSLINFNIR